jgi:hypothetical protein
MEDLKRGLRVIGLYGIPLATLLGVEAAMALVDSRVDHNMGGAAGFLILMPLMLLGMFFNAMNSIFLPLLFNLAFLHLTGATLLRWLSWKWIAVPMVAYLAGAAYVIREYEAVRAFHEANERGNRQIPKFMPGDRPIVLAAGGGSEEGDAAKLARHGQDVDVYARSRRFKRVDEPCAEVPVTEGLRRHGSSKIGPCVVSTPSDAPAKAIVIQVTPVPWQVHPPWTGRILKVSSRSEDRASEHLGAIYQGTIVYPVPVPVLWPRCSSAFLRIASSPTGCAWRTLTRHVPMGGGESAIGWQRGDNATRFVLDALGLPHHD